MKSFWACFVLLLLAAPALAQSDQPAPLEIGGVTFSGSIRERVEAWDWFEPVTGENLYAFSGTLMRFSFSQKKQSYDWNIELAVPVFLGLPNGAVVPAPQGQLGLGGNYYAANDNTRNTAFIFPKQAYFRYKWGHSSLQAGRFEFTDGGEVKPKDPTLATLKRDRIAQRLIGTFGYTDVMRSFDGLNYQYSNGPWNFTAMSTIPTRGVFQVDGWGWVDTPVTYVAVTKEMEFGSSHAEWRAFGIFYYDDRNVLKTDNRPAPVRAADHDAIAIGTYGGHYIMATNTSAGTIDLLGWGALQSGQWGELAQKSGAGAIEVGFQPKGLERVHPWFRAGFDESSGDGNPNDGTHGTFFAILPTPRQYARFPFFNSMNNRDVFGEVILRPTKAFTIRSDVHGLWLTSSADLWYTGGGAYNPWTFGYSGRPANGGSKLANLYDISADYSWKNGISLGLYFGWAQGGDVIKAIYPADANGALGFTEFNYRF